MCALVVYQVYFSDDQLSRLEPEYKPFKNYPTTEFFESKVICDLIAEGKHREGDYFGVVSHHFRDKIVETKHWGPTIANKSPRKFTAEEFEKFVRTYRPDIASYCTHRPHPVFPIAERYHKGISRATIRILKKLNYKVYWDSVSNKVVYFNYFVAKPDVYEDYVTTLLRPAMDLMKNDPEIRAMVNVNSGYKQVSEDLKAQIGYDYYPLHPFICERLINLYMLKRNLKFISW